MFSAPHILRIPASLALTLESLYFVLGRRNEFSKYNQNVSLFFANLRVLALQSAEPSGLRILEPNNKHPEK